MPQITSKWRNTTGSEIRLSPWSGNENINKITCNNVLRDNVWRTNYVIPKFGSAHIVLVSMDLHYGV